LKGLLEKAESARRGLNYFFSISCYTELANYFEERADLTTSRYFHQRCLEVAADEGNMNTLARANLNMGM
jgi:hypothetical protein